MALVAVSPLLGGCFQVQVGNLKAQGLTLVLGPEAGTASLIGRFTNVGTEIEYLRGVTIGDKTMANGDIAVTMGLGQVLPGQSVGFGFESDQSISVKNLDAVVSAYVPISIAFEVNGTVETSVLTVPATGIYEGITPSFPPAPVASPVASAVASAEPSPAAS